MDTRLLWLALGGFAGSVEGFTLGSLLPQIGTETGVTIGQTGLLVTGYSLAYAIGTPVLSTIFGGVERRRVLAGAELWFAACALLFALSPQFGTLLLARIALSLGAGLYTATALATAIAITPPERKGTAISVVVAGQSLAVLVGVPAGAYLASRFGWRLHYEIVCCLALVAGSAIALRLPKGIAGDRRTLIERISVVREPGIPLALLTTVLFMIAAYLPVIYVAPLAASAAGIDKAGLPFVLLANGLGAFTGGNLGGRLADRLGARQAFVVACAGQVLVVVVLVLVPFLPPEFRFAGFLLGMGLGGLVGWGSWPILTSRITELAPKSVTLAVALNLTALNVAVALAAIIGGTTIDRIGVGQLPLVALPFVVAALAIVASHRSRVRTA